MLKSLITKEFKKLERFGFIVRTLQTNRTLRRSMKDLPDVIVIGRRFKGDIYFIEIKTKGDKLHQGQITIKSYLEKSANYFIADEKNYKQIFDGILSFS